jgi:transposase-like protein
MQCADCKGDQFVKAGRDRAGRQIHRCPGCGRRWTGRSGSAFSGYRFPDDVIALAVRWYLRYRLSYVEAAERLAERGVTVDPSTIFDWVPTFTPLFVEAAQKHRQRVPTRCRVDETWMRRYSRLASAGGTYFGLSMSRDRSSTPTSVTDAMPCQPAPSSSERSLQQMNCPLASPATKPNAPRQRCVPCSLRPSIAARNISTMV